MSQALEHLKELRKDLSYYERACNLLSWDMYTKTPRAGYEDMGEALTYFSIKALERSSSDEMLEALEALKEPQEFQQLSPLWQESVSFLLREIEKDRRIPKDFYASYVDAQNASSFAWRQARQEEDYCLFAPHLDTMIDLTRQLCAYTDPGQDCLTVLLEKYEEGMGEQVIDPLFKDLKEGLIPLVERISKEPYQETGITGRYADPADQKKVQDLLLDYIGFSRESGATAESEHPFTSGFSSRDVRVTNHFRPFDLLSSMFSAIHEGGHGIFMQNVSADHLKTPMDDCRFYGVHESQSRFYENILGRSQGFWVPIYPKVQALLPALKDVSLEDFVREINHVTPSLIRTEADEVTYGLHIILRYELEKAMFREGARAKDLPELWNERMKSYLGLTPKKDSEGILQDMHWSDGSFGYFPSYLLGSIYDGMFLEAMEKELGDAQELLREGRILEITHWLNEKIHQYGSLYRPSQVIERVCHRPLSTAPLLNYFYKKHGR